MEQPEGTGLGLFICRRIVERYGGAIRLESEQGGDGAFVIEPPAVSV